MSNAIHLLRRYFSMFLAFLLALIPLSGAIQEDRDESIRMSAAIVSDVHIDRRLPLGQLALKNCYRDMRSLSPDAALVLGDLTNYGDYATLERFFEITKASLGDVAPVVISGNHDIGHAKDADGERMNPEALADFVSLCNEYLDYAIDTPYYTRLVNGYAFICLNDESESNWDHP